MAIGKEDVDRPDVVAEIGRLADLYETALVAGDLDTVDSFFWQDPRALRFGIADEQYGFESIRIFRRSLARQTPPRKIERRAIGAFGRDCATVDIEFAYLDGSGSGRQSQVWVRTAAAGHGGWRIVRAHVSFRASGGMP